MNWNWKSKLWVGRSAAQRSPSGQTLITGGAAPGNASSSRRVRKLTHRRPIPRTAAGRFLYFLESLPSLPRTLLATSGFIALCVVFYQFVSRSEYFALGEITIEGNQRVSTDAILACLGSEFIIEGVSTIGLRAGAAEKVLKTIPEVQDAIVEVVWPDRLQVAVVERRPAGIYISERESLLFDSTGLLFTTATGADIARAELPIITGLSKAGLQRGETIPAESLTHITRFRSVMTAAAPSLLRKVSELHVEPAEGLTLVMHDGSRFACGWRPAEEVGPVVEALVAQQVPGQRLVAATLYSNTYVSVERQPIPAAVELPQVASTKRRNP